MTSLLVVLMLSMGGGIRPPPPVFLSSKKPDPIRVKLLYKCIKFHGLGSKGNTNSGAILSPRIEKLFCQNFLKNLILISQVFKVLCDEICLIPAILSIFNQNALQFSHFAFRKRPWEKVVRFAFNSLEVTGRGLCASSLPVLHKPKKPR